jgi:hypothetical protein
MIDLPVVPTRRDHALEAGDELRRALEGASEPLRKLADHYRSAIIERRVEARRHERPAARFEERRHEYALAVCERVGERLGLSASAVAALALLGQGGPNDEGGDAGGSSLPILPESRIWRWKRRVGGAWIAALREVAGDFHFLISMDYDGGMCVSVEGDDPDWGCWLLTAPADRDSYGPVAGNVEIARAVRRGLVRGRAVDGRDVETRVMIDGPRELACEIAIAAVESAIAAAKAAE